MDGTPTEMHYTALEDRVSTWAPTNLHLTSIPDNTFRAATYTKAPSPIIEKEQITPNNEGFDLLERRQDLVLQRVVR